MLRQHPGLTLVPDDGLKERCLGSMEGRRRHRGEPAPDDAESHAEYVEFTTCFSFDPSLLGHPLQVAWPASPPLVSAHAIDRRPKLRKGRR